ncbi:MAG: CHRD domain-containing protein [Planctomycetes bacterium]|nr:CHRD domain-containing protein [Planctomycetota bacterium]
MSRCCAMISVLVLSAGAAVNAEIVNFNAVIDGAQADDCNGTGSGSTGTATFTLDTVTFEVTYSIEYSALDGTENNAHVHSAAACNPGGVVYPLPAGSPKNGNETLSEAEADDMLAGLHYVNIHSTLHGGGEIRGQILLEPAVPTASTWGVATLVLLVLVTGTVVIRRRAVA